MTDQQLDLARDTKEYVAALTAHLFRHQVPGSRIGEILAEVESHVGATGENARTAFGPPEDYARAWATPMTARQRWRRGLRITAVVAGAAGSGAVLAEGALAAGRGTTVLGVNGWWVVGLAGLALVAVIAAAPRVRVLDPRTGRPRAVGRVPLLLGAGAVLLVTVVLLVMTGAWTAAAS